MRTLGMILFLLGTAIASTYAARAVEALPSAPGEKITGIDRIRAWGGRAGLPFGVGFALMIAGGVTARRARRGGKQDDETRAAEHDAEAHMQKIAEALAGVPSAQASVAPEIHAVLDQILEEEIPAFLEGRQRLIDDLGLASFAEMIGQFAVMERNVARAWSALTDEVYHEVDPSLERARTGLNHALEAYQRARPRT